MIFFISYSQLSCGGIITLIFKNKYTFKYFVLEKQCLYWEKFNCPVHFCSVPLEIRLPLGVFLFGLLWPPESKFQFWYNCKRPCRENAKRHSVNIWMVDFRDRLGLKDKDLLVIDLSMTISWIFLRVDPAAQSSNTVQRVPIALKHSFLFHFVKCTYLMVISRVKRNTLSNNTCAC